MFQQDCDTELKTRVQVDSSMQSDGWKATHAHEWVALKHAVVPVADFEQGCLLHGQQGNLSTGLQ